MKKTFYILFVAIVMLAISGCGGGGGGSSATPPPVYLPVGNYELAYTNVKVVTGTTADIALCNRVMTDAESGTFFVNADKPMVLQSSLSQYIAYEYNFAQTGTTSCGKTNFDYPTSKLSVTIEWGKCNYNPNPASLNADFTAYAAIFDNTPSGNPVACSATGKLTPHPVKQ